MLYKEEGIKNFPKFDYKDNSDVLVELGNLYEMLQDLVKSKHKDGNPSEKFFTQVQSKYPVKRGKKKPKNAIIYTNQVKNSFVVTHFAGEVEYDDWKNFYARSLDVLSPHLALTLSLSKNSVLAELFDSSSTAGGGGGGGGGKKKKKLLSVGKAFQSALTDLVQSIGQTKVHYVRCLKSNLEQDPMKFDASYVERQMEQAGIPAAGKILIAGYPYKFSHYDFYMMHRNLVSWGRDVGKDLAQADGQDGQASSVAVDFCKRLVEHVMEEFPAYQGTVVGKTLVMFGIIQQKALRQFCRSRKAIICLQAMERGALVRRSKKNKGRSEGMKMTKSGRQWVGRTLRKESTVRRYSSQQDLML